MIAVMQQLVTWLVAKFWDECVSKRAAILPKALSVVLC